MHAPGHCVPAGTQSFAVYVSERLDVSPRTAWCLVRLARAEHRAPAVADAFREGRLTAFQAELLLRVASPGRAPDRLYYELGTRPGAEPLMQVRSGDVLNAECGLGRDHPQVRQERGSGSGQRQGRHGHEQVEARP
jgi:hypothetical protein